MSTHADEDVHPSIEVEEEDQSIFSDRTKEDGESYLDDSLLDADTGSPAPDGRRDSEGDESSSHHDATDEDVFTDKSGRSSMGSYDAGSESGKKMDADNMTTITSRSPRISDISQYDVDEDFVPTARGTPRPPFRTPSDVRAMQMSSPASSVHGGSPRSSRKHFPTVSRLGTPSASAQYSPKRKSTPPRFKSRQEAPLVLLHVVLLPLRWVWGDLVSNLDPAEMTEQTKTLRDSWRMLQDRVGDTVIERGILLPHPQNDYEVLEERLLEALELPVRRRARILECGHYLGPSNEATLTSAEGEESEDDFGQERRRSAGPTRHWCGTCKSEIRYNPLGDAKTFRVKVYASNGLMRAGAWEACWKEMERVDVEIEPIVEPDVQDEIVRLAAAQQERELTQHEEDEIAKEVAAQFEEQRRSEERLQEKQQQQQQARAQSRMSSSSSPPPSDPAKEQTPEFVHERAREPSRSASYHRTRETEEERRRETYGERRPPPTPESEPHQDASHNYNHQHHHHHHHHQQDSYAPSPEDAKGQRDEKQRGYQSASLPELLMQSVRVLMQDRKNIVIVTLSVFVLMLALRSAPQEASLDAPFHELQAVPEILPEILQQSSLVDVADFTQSVAAEEEEVPVESFTTEPTVTMSMSMSSVEVSQQEEPTESNVPVEDIASTSSTEDEVLPSETPEEVAAADTTAATTAAAIEPSVDAAASESSTPSSSQEIPTASATAASASRSLKPCRTTTKATPTPSVVEPAPVESAAAVPSGLETVEEVETSTVTEKTIVKLVRTVTETQTQIETQTEVETATAFETVKVMATAAAAAVVVSEPEPELEPEPESMSQSQSEVDLDHASSSVNDDDENIARAESTITPDPETETETKIEAETEPVTEMATETGIKTEPAAEIATEISTEISETETTATFDTEDNLTPTITTESIAATSVPEPEPAPELEHPEAQAAEFAIDIDIDLDSELDPICQQDEDVPEYAAAAVDEEF